MWLSNLFRHDRKKEEDGERDRTVNRGVFYLYLILGLQVLLIFGLLGGIMFIGKVIATPLWVFVVMGIGAVWGTIYTYRKIKRQFKKLREAIKGVDLSDRNYEISIMGGVLTMRVEQNQRPPLLEAPSNPSLPVLDTETVETQARNSGI